MQKGGVSAPLYEKRWKENMGKRFWNIDPEIEIRKAVGCKNREMWQELRFCLSR
jgi:hypothetical protein